MTSTQYVSQAMRKAANDRKRGLLDPLPQTDVNNIKLAINDLKNVRDRLRYAGANRAADYVARALKSAEGALRHAEGKLTRASFTR